MSAIHLEGVGKTYPNGANAVHSIDLHIADGEFLVLVGPSGCGKSTTLRMIAGLETPTSGKILFDKDDVTNLPPQHRNLAMVFQSYALYPHMSVRQNLEFGLRMRGEAVAVRHERITRAAQVLGLEALLDRKPSQLSGGQRQRVALGRAIVREPRAFLFDEPLSNLDAKLRVQTRAELARMHQQMSATMIYVTHDQEEAMTLGDRIAVLSEGRLQQCAPPIEIYQRPANLFVAGFIGSPSMNFLPCTSKQDGSAARLEAPWLRKPLEVGAAIGFNQALRLGIRPQDLKPASEQDAHAIAKVDVIQLLGSDSIVHLDIQGEGPPLRATMIVSAESPLRTSQTTGLSLQADRLHIFDEQSGRRLN